MQHFLCCLLQCLLCVQWSYNNLSSEYNRWLSWDMRRNLLWCFCRKICSNSWKMKLPCLRDIGRVLVILWLQTSRFNTAVKDILLYYDTVNFKHSLILKTSLTLGLFSSAKIAQHSPNGSHNIWFRESFVTELGQNYKLIYRDVAVCIQPHKGTTWLWFLTVFLLRIWEILPKSVEQQPCVPEAVKLMKVHFKHLSKSLVQNLSLIVPFKLPTKQLLRKSKVGEYTIQASY